MTRDFRAEILQAVQANDVAALSAIAYNLLGRVEQDDERRTRQAEKKRQQREKRVGGTSGMSRLVPGHPGTSGDIPPVDPPLRSLTTPPPPSAQVIAKLGDAHLQTALDLLRAKFSAEEWEDVATFFLRRKYSAWYEWAKAMIRDLGPGSQFEPADLLSVCRDDGTLEKKIGSAGVLRKFLAIARIERTPPPSERAPPGKVGPRAPSRVMPGAQPFPAPSDPDKPPKWT